MYRLAITRDFIAQHFLIGGDWGAENTRHSHHYRLQVRLRGDALDRHGYLCDIVELERVLDEVLGGYRDRTLNELAPFAGLNPSLERFAKILYDELLARLDRDNHAVAVQLAALPDDIRGFGHIKAANLQKARDKWAQLLARFRGQQVAQVIRMPSKAA